MSAQMTGVLPETNVGKGWNWLVRSRAWIGLLIIAPFGVVAIFSPPHAMEGSWGDIGLDTPGWILFVIGAAFRWWATLYIGGKKLNSIVTEGPYSVCRNPLYLGTFLMIIGFSFYLESLTLAVGAIVAAAFYLVRHGPRRGNAATRTIWPAVYRLLPDGASLLAAMAALSLAAGDYRQRSGALVRSLPGGTLAMAADAGGNSRPVPDRGVVSEVVPHALNPGPLPSVLKAVATRCRCADQQSCCERHGLRRQALNFCKRWRMSAAPIETSPETDWRPLYPFASHFLRLDAGRYHYLDEGAGKPLLLVHGNPTWSFHWRNLIAALRDRYRVVAPDHLGCGLSDKPQHFDYRLASHIDNLSRLVTELDLRDATLVAQDWGGAIGLGAVLRTPERFSRLVLFNTAAFRASRMPWRIRICRTPGLGPILVRGLNGFARAALRMAVERPERLTLAVRSGYLFPYDSWRNRVAIDRFVRDIPMRPSHPSYSQLVEIERGLPTLADRPDAIDLGHARLVLHAVVSGSLSRILPRGRGPPHRRRRPLGRRRRPRANHSAGREILGRRDSMICVGLYRQATAVLSARRRELE